MKNFSDTLQAKSAGAVSQNQPGTAGLPLTDDWRLARERLMLYLELLSMPRQQADKLATEAIHRAGLGPRENPVKAAMVALWELLGEEKLRITSMPPLNRGAMVPVEIDRQPWWTFFKKRILRLK
jgi:hypothetical protein